MPEAEDSFEDTPATLIGYLKRDQRWCQGNLQHSRLLLAPSWASTGNIDYFLGTDDLGRDILSRIIGGAQISLAVGIGSTVLGLLVGGVIATVILLGGNLNDAWVTWSDYFAGGTLDAP